MAAFCQWKPRRSQSLGCVVGNSTQIAYCVREQDAENSANSRYVAYQNPNAAITGKQALATGHLQLYFYTAINKALRIVGEHDQSNHLIHLRRLIS